MRCQLERSTADTANPSLFSMVKVQTAEQVAAWLNPFMQGFSIKEECRGFMQTVFSSMATTVAHPFEHYVLFLYGVPIAIGSLHFKYGTAVIYNIATLTEFRKKGAASAMVQFLKTRTLEAGYSEVFLFALESAQSTYQRLGFKSICAGYDIYALDK
jgi:ribosomal protein S18 acetylase RimI-like enzyme